MGHFAIYARWLFGWRYISSQRSADELHQERNRCPLLRSCFIGSCHVGVSKRFSRSISLAVFAFIHFILADQISCRSYVGSVYRMRSLAVSYSFEQKLSAQFKCPAYARPPPSSLTLIGALSFVAEPS